MLRRLELDAKGGLDNEKHEELSECLETVPLFVAHGYAGRCIVQQKAVHSVQHFLHAERWMGDQLTEQF